MILVFKCCVNSVAAAVSTNILNCVWAFSMHPYSPYIAWRSPVSTAFVVPFTASLVTSAELAFGKVIIGA